MQLSFQKEKEKKNDNKLRLRRVKSLYRLCKFFLHLEKIHGRKLCAFLLLFIFILFLRFFFFEHPLQALRPFSYPHLIAFWLFFLLYFFFKDGVYMRYYFYFIFCALHPLMNGEAFYIFQPLFVSAGRL